MAQYHSAWFSATQHNSAWLSSTQPDSVGLSQTQPDSVRLIATYFDSIVTKISIFPASICLIRGDICSNYHLKFFFFISFSNVIFEALETVAL